MFGGKPARQGGLFFLRQAADGCSSLPGEGVSPTAPEDPESRWIKPRLEFSSTAVVNLFCQ
jgi:hypothetical protein